METEEVQAQTSVAGEIGTAVKHGAVYGLGQVLAKGLGFFMLPLYTHYLTPADYGVLEILDLSMSLFGMFLAMGIITALLRCYTGASSEEKKRKIISTALMFVLVSGMLTFSVGLFFLRPVSALVLGPKIPPYYLLLSFASLILGYIGNIPRTYLRALDHSGAFVSVDTITLFCLLGLNVFFIAVLKIGLVGILLSSLIVFSVQVVLLSAWTVRKVGFGYDRAALWQMLAYGAPLMFSNLALFTLNFSDRFFLQHLRSLAVVGVYAVGYKFGFMLNYLLVQPFFVMWQSRMYAIHKRADHREIFGQICVLYTLVLSFAALALSVFSTELVHVMAGPQFAASGSIVPVVTMAYVFYGLGYYAELGMYLTDSTKWIGGVGAGAAVLNLGLNYFLVLRYGMMGAAWATLFSFAAIAVVSYWISQRVNPLPLHLWRVLAILSVATGLYLPFEWWSAKSMLLTLAAKTAAVIVFPFIIWVLRILSPGEIGTLVSARKYALERFLGPPRPVAAA